MKKLLVAMIVLGLVVIGVYVYFHGVGRVQVRPNEIFITAAEIPEPFNGVRIVQISDVMVRQESCLELLENTVATVNNLAPEIILFTGNLFLSEGLVFQQRVIQILSELEVDLVKLAVLGYDDLAHEAQTTRVLTDAGFRILNNESTQVFNLSPVGINFIGAHPLNNRATMEQLLNDHTMNDRANILLASIPTFANMAFDYPLLAQFSGHCLATQDTSHRHAPCFQFYQGTYQFANRFTLHVSTGLARFQTTQNLLRPPSIDSFLLISAGSE